jgi:predicted Fe-S protein YdhL (DUF1289 family)
VCRVDEASGWCLGCKRTYDEIWQWPILPHDRQWQILHRLKQREFPDMSQGKPPSG